NHLSKHLVQELKQKFKKDLSSKARAVRRLRTARESASLRLLEPPSKWTRCTRVSTSTPPYPCSFRGALPGPFPLEPQPRGEGPPRFRDRQVCRQRHRPRRWSTCMMPSANP
ncbi:hypothetical protein M407DRAFT_235396, partial [Tulasnella calospora MUT 4182]